MLQDKAGKILSLQVGSVIICSLSVIDSPVIPVDQRKDTRARRCRFLQYSGSGSCKHTKGSD
jgi:hypothetical protein